MWRYPPCYYSLNGSGYVAASTTNQWTNWTGNLNLVAGTNTVQAYAVDTSGNLSPTNTVQFEYVVLQAADGADDGTGSGQSQVGTLNPSYTNGTLLAINENYTLTANAAGGIWVYQLDGRVRERADQSGDAAVHDGDEPDVAGEFCGCDQTGVEHRESGDRTSNGPTERLR